MTGTAVGGSGRMEVVVSVQRTKQDTKTEMHEDD